MKKVLFTATVDSHILHFHLPYLKLFKDNGYEVHVATNGKEKIPYCDKKHVITFERSPYKINNLKAIKQLKKIIEEEKFEIIHTHTPMGSVVTRLAAKNARKNGTRVIYTAHGFHFYKGAPLLNWVLFYPVEKYLSKYTDTLITINDEDYQLAKKKFKKTNVEYIPGVGIDPQKFDIKITDKEKNELRKELGLKKDDFVMIYPAELNKNKNQILLIEAMEKLISKYTKIHLLLPGKDSYNGYYQKIIKERNLEKNIHILGYRKDIPKLLKIADLAVATSKREGLPINIIEAMYIGLPIIATNCRGQRDLVKNEKNGYIIDVNDRDNIIDKIEILYQNKEIYNQFSNENKNIVKEYLLENIIFKIEKIYNKKRKVLHILASNKYSGAENVVCTIIKSLEKECDMAYCSPNGDISKILKKEKIKYFGLKKLSKKEIQKIINIYKPDIIHAHDYKASILTSFCTFKGVVISHLHKNDNKVKKISLKSCLYIISTRKFKKIIVVSNSIIEEFIFSKYIKNKFYCINNYIDQNKIIKMSQEFNINKKYDIFFIGRLSPEKAPLKFIEIIYKLKDKNPNIKAVMIGNGIEWNNCKTKIMQYSLDKNIEMLGFKENPFPYIKNSKYGIMPSKYEGFGLSAIESMILNKPIFNSGVGGLKEIFKEDPFFICKNIDEYIKKINNYKETHDLNKLTKKYTNKNTFTAKLKDDVYEI